jgi:putative transposase
LSDFFNRESALFTVLVIGGVDRKAYIKMMEQEAQEAAEIGRQRVMYKTTANTPMPRSPKIMAKVGKSRFIYLLFAQVLFRNEPN